MGYLGCDRLGCCGPVRREAAVKPVELAFIEEQEALARAGIFGRDLPRDGGRPCSTHLQNAIAWCAYHTPRQSVRVPLIHELMHPLTLVARRVPVLL